MKSASAAAVTMVTEPEIHPRESLLCTYEGEREQKTVQQSNIYLVLVDVIFIIHPSDFIIEIDQHERRASGVALDIFVQLLQQGHLHIELFQFVFLDVFLVRYILTLLWMHNENYAKKWAMKMTIKLKEIDTGKPNMSQEDVTEKQQSNKSLANATARNRK